MGTNVLKLLCLLATVVNSSGPRWSGPWPEDYEVVAGATATFRCTPDAINGLTPEVTWEFMGRTIDFDNQPRFKMTSDYSLLISDTTELDSGPYMCIVKTPVGEARSAGVQATLTVQDKPNPPVLEGIECEERSANLKWRPTGDNRAPILRFSIQYNTTFTPDTWDVANDNVVAIESKYSVGLSPWANYTFRVIAHNKIGPSRPSGHSEVCTTQTDVPYTNPEKVEGRGTAPNNMVIFWSKIPQIEHNGPGFYYKVSYKRNMTGEPWTDQTMQDWRQTKLLVPNTPTFVPYKIKVTAWNSIGASNVAPTEVIGWSGEDMPLLAPTNLTLVEVISSNEALFTWNSVPPDSVRGHFYGYLFQTWIEGEENQVHEVKVKSDSTRVIINTLKPHRKNIVQVMVYNGVGIGPPSDTLSLITPEGKPGAVHTFNAYPISSSSMLLIWDKPMEENGVLTGYKVYYGKTVGMQVGPMVERKKVIDPKFLHAKLAGLEPDTKYRIEVRAQTKAGEGHGFFVEQATRDYPMGVPDVPQFEARALPMLVNQPGSEQAVHVLVRWLPALDGHPGTHFQVSHRLKGQWRWELSRLETDEDYVIITGLEAKKLYEVKVTAYDGAYLSESEVKELDTSAILRPRTHLDRDTDAIPFLNKPNVAAIVIAVIALIVTVILIVIIFTYRRKVQELKRAKIESSVELMASRPPVPLPPEVVYDHVYSHGAGMFRPRIKSQPKLPRCHSEDQ